LARTYQEALATERGMLEKDLDGVRDRLRALPGAGEALLLAESRVGQLAEQLSLAEGRLVEAAAQADANAGRYVAANCANCHGTQGLAKGAMPSLAGQKKEYIVEQMRAFRDGKRPATIMHQLAKGYTDAQIEATAEFFARQPAAR
jgi:cytochrome c553